MVLHTFVNCEYLVFLLSYYSVCSVPIHTYHFHLKVALCTILYKQVINGFIPTYVWL